MGVNPRFDTSSFRHSAHWVAYVVDDMYLMVIIFRTVRQITKVKEV